MCAVNRREEKSININKFELLVIIVMMTGSLILVLWKLMGDTHSCFVQFQEFSQTLQGYVYTGPV